jgi:hypothetical protein
MQRARHVRDSAQDENSNVAWKIVSRYGQRNLSDKYLKLVVILKRLFLSFSTREMGVFVNNCGD